LTAVLFPERANLELLDYLPRTISRSIIDDDDIAVGRVLGEYACDRISNVIFIITAIYYDRKL